MRLAVKIVSGDGVERDVERVVVEQDRAQHGLLGFEIIRRNAPQKIIGVAAFSAVVGHEVHCNYPPENLGKFRGCFWIGWISISVFARHDFGRALVAWPRFDSGRFFQVKAVAEKIAGARDPLAAVFEPS